MSALSDAIVGSITNQFDSEKQAVAKYLDSQSEDMATNARVKKADAVSKISKLIEAEQEKDKPSASVLDAFDRIMAQLSS